MNDLERMIEYLRKFSIAIEDLQLTDDDKEHELKVKVVDALDNLRYFYEDKLEESSVRNVKIDLGYEYVMGIYENVVHRVRRSAS